MEMYHAHRLTRALASDARQAPLDRSPFDIFKIVCAAC
jgi:hypothetical protein